jgi:hypothetical protein
MILRPLYAVVGLEHHLDLAVNREVAVRVSLDTPVVLAALVELGGRRRRPARTPIWSITARTASKTRSGASESRNLDRQYVSTRGGSSEDRTTRRCLA